MWQRANSSRGGTLSAPVNSEADSPILDNDTTKLEYTPSTVQADTMMWECFLSTVSSSWTSHEHLSNLYTSWTQLILIPINIPAGEGWLQHGYSKVFFSDLQSPQTRNTFQTRCQRPFSNTSHTILQTGLLFNKGSKLDVFTKALCPLKAVWL